MKKITFYRLIRTDNGIGYQADTGYLVRITRDGFILDLAIAKNKYGRWNITHTATGLLVSRSSYGYYTRQEAFDSITDDLVNAIISRLSTRDVIRYVDMLSEYAYQQQAARA